MYGEFLPVFVENAKGDADDLWQDLQNTSPDWRSVLELCRHHRIVGIGAFLLGARCAQLFDGLYRSGRTYGHFLAVLGSDSAVLSRGTPFFDAIACGDTDSVSHIVERSPRQWKPDLEYEEDFLYVDFVMKHFFREEVAGECEAVLGRFEEVLEGAHTPRFAVCQAFFSGDSELFEQGFTQLLAEDADRDAGLLQKGVVEPEVAATEVHVHIEGLAVLRLAARRGFATRREYPRVPSLARLSGGPYSADAWRAPYGPRG